MVIDSSAVIAIMQDEPDAHALSAAIADAARARLGIVNYVEASIVIIARDGEVGDARLREWLGVAGIEIVPAELAVAEGAKLAFRLFGKGRHPARLNFCDCFAYALAKHFDEPLLFKGDDFRKTDVTAAL